MRMNGMGEFNKEGKDKRKKKKKKTSNQQKHVITKACNYQEGEKVRKFISTLFFCLSMLIC